MSRTEWSMTKLCMLMATALVLCLVLGAAPVGAVVGVRYVDQNLTRNCLSKTPCHDSIQEAVDDADPGDTIYVFPGTYEEGVDLSGMETEGDITLITVDASGNPTPGTVTVDNPGDEAEIYTGDPLMPFDGDVTIDGFVLRSFYGAIDLWVGPFLPAPQGEDLGVGPVLGWDVEIRNVDASHTGGDGISVRAQGNVTIKDCTTNDNTGYGIGVYGTYGDVTITGCTANDNHRPPSGVQGGFVCPSGGICVWGVSGQVKIKNSTANNNDYDGIHVDAGLLGEGSVSRVAVLGEVIIDRCTANQNEDEGIQVRSFGDVTITSSTANDNGESGVQAGGPLYGEELGLEYAIDGGSVLIENCTAIGNEYGFDVEGIGGTLSIQACIARDNHTGVDLYSFGGPESVLVNGSIICGNECGVYLGGGDSLQGTVVGMNLEGNWWGCPGGPEADGCDPICEPQEASILVDFTPWISKISASATVDPATVGQPTVVSFQFSANPSAVYLGQGPGDLRGPAPFTVTTNNGKLNGNGATVQEFINAANGTLEVTLVPAREGTATVTVSGPCGLGELEGATAVLGVGAEFVPEPGTVLLLGSGLMGLAGYAALRLRKRYT